MSRLTQRGATGPVELFNTSTDASLATLVGSKFDSADGREFVLVQNAGTALVSGTLIQGPAPIANHQNLTTVSFTAASANGNIPASAVVTLAGTLATANQYAQGYALVNAGTGIGQTLKIRSHGAGSSSGNITVVLEDSPGVALDATSKVCLRLNPYGTQNGTDFRTSGVTVSAHAANTGQTIGVALYPIAATSTSVLSYGLIQTAGLVACLNDATTTVGASGGLDVMPSSNTDGAVMTYAVATGSRVGTSTQTGVTTEARQITLQL